jgi:putative aminopeptidase FrvX
MQTSRGGIPVCTLSIPCRYVHSACEVVDLRDIEGGVKLLNQYFQA